MPRPAIVNGRKRSDIRETRKSRAILVGVDGSPPSYAAVRWAAHEAVMRAVGLKLVHIVAAPVVTQTLTPVTTTMERSDERAREVVGVAAELARGTARAIGAAVPTVDSEIYYSTAIPTLIELSADAGMVVLGTRGHGTFRRGLAASACAALVHHAHCPVALIHDTPAPPADAPVVVGISSSPESVVGLATEIAYQEAAQRGVGLIAVHAWSDADLFAVPGVNWTALHDEYPTVRVRRVIPPQQSARNLAQVAEGAQLLVVGAEGRGGVTSMLAGSLSATLAHCLQIPLIVARQMSPGTDLRRRAQKLVRARRASLSP